MYSYTPGIFLLCFMLSPTTEVCTLGMLFVTYYFIQVAQVVVSNPTRSQAA